MRLPTWFRHKECPVPKCNHKWRTKDTLRGHLYNSHLKADLVEVILNGEIPKET